MASEAVPVAGPSLAHGGRSGWSVARRREATARYLFLLPWALGFVLFVAGPVLASAYLSFTAYDVMRPPRYVGLENYVRAFTTDAQFVGAFKVTFVYALISVPLALFGSLLLALLLN